MSDPENISFEKFKDDFYSRINDFSIFDFGEYNALKIVLDGLKVNYAARFKSKAYMFYPLWLLRLIFFIKYTKHKKELPDIKNHSPQKEILLYDNSGRYSLSEDGQEVSFYYHKIITEIGAENLHHVTYHRKSDVVQYDWVCEPAFFLRYSKLSKKRLELRKSLLKLYKNIAGSGIFHKNELENIRIAISSFFEQVNYWEAVPTKLPFLKTAVIEMHYHNESLIYCLKQRKIRVIEIQHGLISPKDIFYVFPHKIRSVKSRALLPDKIFVVGQYWKDILLKGADYADDPNNIIVLGNYYTTTTTLPAEQKAVITEFVKQSEVILVTTQTMMHNDFVPYVQWLSEDLARRGLGHKIVVKTHPSEKIENYNALQGLNNVLVTQSSLYYLFSISKIHISIYSTTLYDALEFNLQNFSLACDYAEDYRGELLKDGIALPLLLNENPVDLLASGKSRKTVTTAHSRAYYFDDFNNNRNKLLPLPVPPILHCSKCILSSEDTGHIFFDKEGVCNYCHYYDSVTNKLGSPGQRKNYILAKVDEIKLAGKGKEHDCILGVSGGVDSSYLAYWAKQNGLRPLVVHFDNGWNSELAVENISRICDILGFSLQTYVIDWQEFKQLQLAYLRAGVIDIEALTDHAIYATIYKIAKKHGIRHTINGFNYATEAIMPKGWVFDKTDFTNIKDINKKFGTGKIKTFPHITFLRKFWYGRFLKTESIRVLNYIDYNKEAAKELLKEKLGWRDYGGKHYESVFTKFYQAYILPQKFRVDKRKAHLSSLICSGQVTREEALLELAKPLYDPAILKEEKEYVLKKLGLPDAEFNAIMNEKPRQHTDFKTQQKMWDAYFRLIKILRPWKK